MKRRRIPNGASLAERLEFYVERTETCWMWTGPTRGGYGRFIITKNGEKSWHSAHRVSYELNIGPIPDGLFVLHKCDVRNCINPDHLFLGDHQANSNDMRIKGRDNHFSYTDKDTCQKGHSLDDVYIYKGTRRCRTCKNEAWKANYYRNREQRLSKKRQEHQRKKGIENV